MADRFFFTNGLLAKRIMKGHALKGENLRDLLNRKLQKNKRLVRPAAKELGISHQTLFNWCFALKIPTLTRKKAMKINRRDVFSRRQKQLLQDFGMPGWCFEKTLVKVFVKAADCNLDTLEIITGTRVKLLKVWCRRYKIPYFNSIRVFNNYQHYRLVKKVENLFGNLGANWAEITEVVMRLHNYNLYAAAKHLGIQNITLVRWCSYLGIKFMTNPSRRSPPDKHFEIIQRKFSNHAFLPAH